jgi:hypothetical protein
VKVPDRRRPLGLGQLEDSEQLRQRAKAEAWVDGSFGWTGGLPPKKKE